MNLRCYKPLCNFDTQFCTYLSIIYQEFVLGTYFGGQPASPIPPRLCHVICYITAIKNMPPLGEQGQFGLLMTALAPMLSSRWVVPCSCKLHPLVKNIFAIFHHKGSSIVQDLLVPFPYGAGRRKICFRQRCPYALQICLSSELHTYVVSHFYISFIVQITAIHYSSPYRL